MSRTRIALATASVLLGISGAIIVLKATENDGAKAGAAAVPKGSAISVVQSGSVCVVDRTAGVVVFQIVLHNFGTHDRATRVHLSVGLRDGRKIFSASSGTKASLLATERRKYEIDVPYEPATQRPDGCQVALGEATPASIAIRKAS